MQYTTPVKGWSWILESFDDVTSRFWWVFCGFKVSPPGELELARRSHARSVATLNAYSGAIDVDLSILIS